MTGPMQLEEAYAALRAVVADLVERDRKTLIQGVKPALQRHTHGRFDERKLGYTGFGEFIEAARRAGVISVHSTMHGYRLDVPGLDRGAVRTHATSDSRQPRIRPDLWLAFTDWSGEQYVWDPATRRACTMSEAAANEADPASLVLIPRASSTAHVAWARELLAARPDDASVRALRAVLDLPDSAFESFSVLIRSNSRLEGEWRQERRERVAEAIRAWAREQRLDVHPFVAADPTESPRELVTPSGDVERLRTVVKQAIDRMSVEDLRALRLPIGALEGTGL